MYSHSILKLFNGVVLSNTSKEKISFDAYNELSKRTIKKGYVIDSRLVFFLPKSELKKLMNSVEKDILVSFSDWNKAFYSSWEKIENMSEVEFRIDQFLHYLTTYGTNFESPFVHIPRECFGDEEDLEVTKDTSIFYVQSLTEEEVKDRLDKIVSSGIALKQETITYIIDAYNEIKTDLYDVLNVSKNKELNVQISEKYDIIPKNVGEFFRFLIFKATGNSLLIKNHKTISQLGNYDCVNYVKKYIKKYGIISLAEKFYRFKPFFLALKRKGLNKEINKIRKLAVKHHKPMKEDFLNSITSKLSTNNYIDLELLKNKLGKTNTFRAVRLLDALRMCSSDYVVYRIRNGKIWVDDRKPDAYCNKQYIDVYLKIYKSIIAKIKENVENKTIFLPKNINYSIPSSEKAFIGNIPIGTSVEVEGKIIAGVHWVNKKDKSVDLDLSLLDLNGHKIGWNSRFREGGVVFSGDLTTAPAPEGSSELFYFNVPDNNFDSRLLLLNYFNNYKNEDEVEYSIVIGSADESRVGFKNNAMLKPSEIVLQAKCDKIGSNQKTIGLVTSENGCAKFYFFDGSGVATRVSSKSDINSKQIQFFEDKIKNTLSLKEVLVEAGVNLVENREEADIDLSPENLTKETLLSLIS